MRPSKWLLGTAGPREVSSGGGESSGAKVPGREVGRWRSRRKRVWLEGPGQGRGMAVRGPEQDQALLRGAGPGLAAADSWGLTGAVLLRGHDNAHLSS